MGKVNQASEDRAMRLQYTAYDMCRSYIRDQQGKASPELLNRIRGWIRSRDFQKLASCGDEFPHALQGKPDFTVVSQVEAFFKKNATFIEPVRCENAARISFFEAEKRCRITNRRLDYYYTKRERLAPDLREWIAKTEMNLGQLLGEIGPFLEEIPNLGKITSGATDSMSRRKAIPFRKVSKRMRCTRRAASYLRALCRFYGYGNAVPRIVATNRIELVRKSWKTDRTIACEPEGNLFLQLAFDEYAKTRLKRWGIDLSDQTKNQRLARVGSLEGSHATIDLAQASDTVAYNCVAWLMPDDWLKYLSDIRCEYGRGRFGYLRYAKFSSMGNGATFALETMIFAAVCKAVGSKTFSVYGDDIVIETELVDDLLRCLRFLGFSVNKAKSFITGPFRESCGANWYKGEDITPFYVRCDMNHIRKPEWCHLVNGLAGISTPNGYLWSDLKEVILREKLPLVPFNGGTMSGVHVSTHSAYTLKLFKTKHQMTYFRVYCPVSRKAENFDSRGLFLWYLRATRRANIREESFIPGFTSPISSSGRAELRKLGFTLFLNSSSYAVPTHKYVRKWIHWFPPVAATPVHLHWWSDFITSPYGQEME